MKKGTGKAVVVGGTLAVVGLLFAGSRRRDRTQVPEGERTGGMCNDTPAMASRYRDATRLRGWVNCPGRSPTEVATLASSLERSRRQADAEMVRNVWNARREVESRPADGTVAPETRAEATAAVEGSTAPRDVPSDPASPPRPAAESSSHSATAEAGAVDPAASSTYDPDRARSLAGRLASTLSRSRPGEYRSRVRDFQRAAGITADGYYGGRTYNALRYYGIQSPPAPHQPPSPDAPEAEYAPSASSRAASLGEHLSRTGIATEV